MKVVGRLEPATLISVGKRVNYCATVTDGRLGRAIINFAKWWHVTLTDFSNPNCELISLY